MQIIENPVQSVTDATVNIDFENWRKRIKRLIEDNIGHCELKEFCKKSPTLFIPFTKKYAQQPFTKTNLLEKFWAKFWAKFQSQEKDKKYAMFFGGWSEYFIETWQADGKEIQEVKDQDFLCDIYRQYTLDDLERSENTIENCIFKSLRKTKNNNWYYNGDFVSAELDLLDDEKMQTVIHDLIGAEKQIFKQVIKHFINNVCPHIKTFISRNNLDDNIREKHGIFDEEDMNKFFLKGELDFYDESKEHVVELKFWRGCSEENWNKWFFQTIAYVYLFGRKYKGCGLKPKGITIINTHSGEKWSATIKELFGDEKKFDRACQIEIPSIEKKQFKRQIKHFYKIYLGQQELCLDKEDIETGFKMEQEEPKELLFEFLKKFFWQNKQEGKDEFQMGDEKYIWSQWDEWKERNL